MKPILPLTRTVTRMEISYEIPLLQLQAFDKFGSFKDFYALIDKAKKELDADITGMADRKITAVVYSQDYDIRLQIMIEKWFDTFLKQYDK